LSWNFSFDGFWSRFYRRELVWTSEEAFGRTQYASLQKQDALQVFLRCLRNCTLGSEDHKKMRRVMKDHRSLLFPALTVKGKLLYFLGTYLPGIYRLLYKTSRS